VVCVWVCAGINVGGIDRMNGVVECLYKYCRCIGDRRAGVSGNGKVSCKQIFKGCCSLRDNIRNPVCEEWLCVFRCWVLESEDVGAVFSDKESHV